MRTQSNWYCCLIGFNSSSISFLTKKKDVSFLTRYVKIKFDLKSPNMVVCNLTTKIERTHMSLEFVHVNIISFYRRIINTWSVHSDTLNAINLMKITRKKPIKLNELHLKWFFFSVWKISRRNSYIFVYWTINRETNKTNSGNKFDKLF